MKREIARLERDTILEATFEMRFRGENKALGDLLPGILFAELKGRFPRTIRTPTSDIPREVQNASSDLRYIPRHGLANDNFQILVGDFTLQISNRRPYVGWANFKPLVLEVLGYLQKTDLISTVERFSLKYVNLLEGEGIAKQFPQIRLKANLGQYDLASLLTIIRTEIRERGLLNIVEIAPTTKVRLPSEKRELEGVMVSVDTIHESPPDFWARSETLLEDVHRVEKSVFFDILTEETITALKPEYQ